MSKNWEDQGDWKTDNNVFLFSVDLRKKYTFKNNTSSYLCTAGWGPVFNGLGIACSGSLFRKDNLREDNLSNNYEIDGGYQEFEISGAEYSTCKDIEVYKVEF